MMARKRRNKGPSYREEILETMILPGRVYVLTEIKKKDCKTTWRISWEGRDGKKGNTIYSQKDQAESRWSQMADNDFIIGPITISSAKKCGHMG